MMISAKPAKPVLIMNADGSVAVELTCSSVGTQADALLASTAVQKNQSVDIVCGQE